MSTQQITISYFILNNLIKKKKKSLLITGRDQLNKGSSCHATCNSYLQSKLLPCMSVNTICMGTQSIQYNTRNLDTVGKKVETIQMKKYNI